MAKYSVALIDVAQNLVFRLFYAFSFLRFTVKFLARNL